MSMEKSSFETAEMLMIKLSPLFLVYYIIIDELADSDYY